VGGCCRCCCSPRSCCPLTAAAAAAAAAGQGAAAGPAAAAAAAAVWMHGLRAAPQRAAHVWMPLWGGTLTSCSCPGGSSTPCVRGGGSSTRGFGVLASVSAWAHGLCLQACACVPANKPWLPMGHGSMHAQRGAAGVLQQARPNTTPKASARTLSGASGMTPPPEAQHLIMPGVLCRDGRVDDPRPPLASITLHLPMWHVPSAPSAPSAFLVGGLTSSQAGSHTSIPLETLLSPLVPPSSTGRAPQQRPACRKGGAASRQRHGGPTSSTRPLGVLLLRLP